MNRNRLLSSHLFSPTVKRRGVLVRFGACVGLALLCTFAQQRDVSALTCVGFGQQFPRNGQSAPTNTLLWGYYWSINRSTALFGPEGQVPLTLRVVQGTGGPFAVFEPEHELQPNSQYRIEYSQENSSTELSYFTTEDGPATAAPPLPVVVNHEKGALAVEQGDEDTWVELQFRATGLLVGARHESFATVTNGNSLLTEASHERDSLSDDFPTLSWLGEELSVIYGRGDCINWPGQSENSVDMKFGVFDLSGNFSGWQENVETVALPSAEEESELRMESQARAAAEREAVIAARPNWSQNNACSSTSTNATSRRSWGGIGLLLFLLGMRRRKWPCRLPCCTTGALDVERPTRAVIIR